MADETIETLGANAPHPPAQAPVSARSETAWRIFLAAFAGAAGTALAGLIFGPGALDAIKKIFVPLPRGAIILVSGDDCGGSGSDWKPTTRGRGSFIVIADQKEFIAGHDEPGAPKQIDLKDYLPSLKAQLKFNGLPPPAGNPAAPGATLFETGLQAEANVVAGNSGKELPLRPPFMAFTACEQK